MFRSLSYEQHNNSVFRQTAQLCTSPQLDVSKCNYLCHKYVLFNCYLQDDYAKNDEKDENVAWKEMGNTYKILV